jgi:hypothetical protein
MIRIANKTLLTVATTPMAQALCITTSQRHKSRLDHRTNTAKGLDNAVTTSALAITTTVASADLHNIKQSASFKTT